MRKLINYNTFSGTDTLVFIMLPNTTPVVLGSLSTFSYSSYREKKPVSIMGKINVNGYTRGVRTVAGTMIFTLINQHWVSELKREVKALQKFHSIKGDELPLFDLMLISANEYGSVVKGYLYGVDILGDGGVISVEDMFSENTINYVARDLDLLESVDPLAEDLSSSYSSTPKAVSMSIEGLEIDEEMIMPPISNELVENKELKFNKENIEIDINNLDLEQVLVKLNSSNSKVCVISYYDSKVVSNFVKLDTSSLYVRDILNSLIFDIETSSNVTLVEILVNDNGKIKKYILKIK